MLREVHCTVQCLTNEALSVPVRRILDHLRPFSVLLLLLLLLLSAFLPLFLFRLLFY